MQRLCVHFVFLFKFSGCGLYSGARNNPAITVAALKGSGSQSNKQHRCDRRCGLPGERPTNHPPAAWPLWHSPLADWGPMFPSLDTDLKATVFTQLALSGVCVAAATRTLLEFCCGSMFAPTWGTVVHQGSQCLPVPPVPVKVGNGKLRDLVLDPAEQTLFGGQFLRIFIILIPPHGHGDGVVQDEGPDQTQDQL